MKKNMFLRVASVLLVLTLLSTCAISGTFAKYVTSASIDNQSARVAKWGVQVSANATNTFYQGYGAGDAGVTANETGTTVWAAENVVAPGTKSGEGVSFSITGTPEVAVNVDVEMTVTKDVFLKQQTDMYLDWTTGNNTTDKFNLAADYEPVVFSLKQGGTEKASGTLEDIKTYLDSISKEYAAGTELSTVFGSFTLTWAWAIETNNQADTLLGQLASGIDDGSTYASNYSTAIDFKIDVTVTQVN